MTIEEELAEYLSYILELEEQKDDKPALIVTCDQDFANGPSVAKRISKELDDDQKRRDEERELVGKAYKKLGGQSATELGHAIVKDKVKEKRIEAWVDFIEENPSAHLYCARGGQRSEIAQSWIAERGIDIPKIEGGFKSLEFFTESKNVCVKI